MTSAHWPHKLQDKEPCENEADLGSFWPIESLWRPHSKPTDELCVKCAVIDFEFFVKNPLCVIRPGLKYVEQEMPLGWLGGIRKRQNCRFCCLVTNVLRLHWSGEQIDEVWKTCKIRCESVVCTRITSASKRATLRA